MGPSPRWLRVDPLAGQENLSAVGRDGVVDQVEDRGLARAVRTDQPGDRAFGYDERAVVDRAQAAEALAKTTDLQEWLGRTTCLGGNGALGQRCEAAPPTDASSDQPPLPGRTAGPREGGPGRPDGGREGNDHRPQQAAGKGKPRGFP